MKRIISFTALCLGIIIGSLGSTVSAQESKQLIYWSEAIKATYSPLLSYTLPWYDEVMKHGGFDFDTESVVTDKDEADFVLNTYSDIGARRIAKIQSFGQPLEKKSITFPTDGLGYPLTSMKIAEGNIFLIEDSDGMFAQVRIDRISSAKVDFSYVIEQEAPKEDISDFAPLDAKYISNDQKVWTLEFNQMMDASTINSDTIYIKDSKGYLLETTITLGYDKRKIYIYPESRYEKGEEYTIFITDAVKSHLGKSVGNVMMPFELDLDGYYPDATEPNQIYGLFFYNSQGTARLSWYSSTANDLAGYRVYYRLKGNTKFLPLLKESGEDLYYKTEIELTGFEYYSGKVIEFYVTAVDRNGNESIPSELASTTIQSGGNGGTGGNGDQGNKAKLAAPSGITMKALNGKVEIDWYDQYELDLLGYYLYISEGSSDNFVRVSSDNGQSVILESFAEVSGLENGTTYYFYLTAVDKNGNESARSETVSVTPTGSYNSTWGGAWSSNYGVINFTQSGSKVTGTYSYGIISGSISGTVEGNTLTGTYYENSDSYGEIVFTMSDNGNSFNGKYKLSNGINWGSWNGTRLP
ncbi:Ig-like domain-containing protein [Bacillus sp. FJAT-29790]|uniref:Ig-like domain-containing protein n=1 Tax=Bacillus sp. FJAT-29790 TaxID=1895002 RepID=UPI001C2442F2|nr:Ig-like domain-containing protein [Bacillus sp. FJAT-29790]MBU8881132.1 Ig-like domain-containing protein [Bacillus sp. FJAT-29790]